MNFGNKGYGIIATNADKTESQKIAELRNDALLKLREAESAWHKLFAALPVGQDRIEASAVFERIRCATRRPV